MNYKMISRVVGLTSLVESFFMAIPMALCLYDGEERIAFCFFIPFMLTLIMGVCLILYGRKGDIRFYVQDSFAATGLSWVYMSVFGALPFYLSGQIPSYIDALFEIVSGFTTTGASILDDVESLSRGILYWRSFSHWLGGMGVLVLLLALVSSSGKSAGYDLYLMQAESPGPSVGKFTPRLRQTALILYGIYILLTTLCVTFLLLGGMSLFESLCTAYGTAGTGGFSVKNSSLGAYSPYIQVVTTVFMLLFGVNFSVHHLFLTGKIKSALKNEEFRLYLGITFTAALLIVLNIRGMFEGFWETVRHSFFQVSSIITTTGFTTCDFDLWPAFSKSILLLLMCLGACAGSTGGGIKMARLLILIKAVRRNIRKLLHPNQVKSIHVNAKALEERVINNVHSYLALYCVICMLSTMFVAIDGYSIGTNISAVIACFNNIGPGFEMVGASRNYSIFSALPKLVLIMDMLLGRLEIFPILILFGRDTWKPSGQHSN